MSKALNTWRTTANKIKDEDFETDIKKKWPQIQEEDWKEFVKSH
jgi:fructose-1-phosphate kinase PfkB-like protein